MAGLSREQIALMTEKELREHVDALEGLERAERELLGDRIDEDEARRAKRRRLLGKTKGRR